MDTTIDAREVVEAIGSGVANALKTNELFLGIEVDAFKNADIHPEYVTTVEVAKRLTGVARQVSLETHMKELRKQARALAWAHRRHTKEGRAEIDMILAPYKFGKKDSRRLDILVRTSDTFQPPLLIAEAKLGVKNLPGVIQDIERVTRLLEMYHSLGLLGSHEVYGAALFHSMVEGDDTGAIGPKAQALLDGVEAHLANALVARPWLNAKAGLLQRGARVQPITGYREYYEDGKSEEVFAKDSFSFAPGLVLLGNAADVNTVNF